MTDENKRDNWEILRNTVFLLFMLLIAFLAMTAFAHSQTYISSVSPIYQNKTQVVPVYETVKSSVKYDCIKDNKTMETVKDGCTRETYEQVFKGYKTEVTESKIIGYIKDGKEIKGYVNEQDGIVSVWSYDIKNRNMQEYGRCREYEKEKGVCYEI